MKLLNSDKTYINSSNGMEVEKDLSNQLKRKSQSTTEFTNPHTAPPPAAKVFK